MKEIAISKRSEAALTDIYWAICFFTVGEVNNQAVIDLGICQTLVDNLQE